MASLSLKHLYIEIGGVRKQVGRIEIPECLAIWWRNRGVQLYWSGRPHIQRLSIRDEPPPPDVVERGRELAERYGWGKR